MEAHTHREGCLGRTPPGWMGSRPPVYFAHRGVRFYSMRSEGGGIDRRPTTDDDYVSLFVDATRLRKRMRRRLFAPTSYLGRTISTTNDIRCVDGMDDFFDRGRRIHPPADCLFFMPFDYRPNHRHPPPPLPPDEFAAFLRRFRASVGRGT